MTVPILKIDKEPSPDQKRRVLTKAFMRMAEQLDLSRQELSRVLGKSPASLSRLYNQSAYIDPETTEGQIVMLLLRLYRSLDTLFGGNVQQCQVWLRSHNKHLNGIPVQLIESVEGLVLTVQYLDAMRGKN